MHGHKSFIFRHCMVNVEHVPVHTCREVKVRMQGGACVCARSAEELNGVMRKLLLA